jgi:iron(III) transport system ATP-binding protein
MVAGFTEPDEGEIYLDDRPMRPVPPHRRNTALVFQNYALWPHMNVSENVAYGLRERRVGREERLQRVEEALRRVRMEQYAGRMPNQLSGGQQQRVALARALVIEPEAVLLDEPLSNLDARLRLEMRHEIRRIHDETGITMLYVTHDQKEALSMADRVAVMSMGRVEQVGDPRAVYRQPRNEFVANFIGEANLIAGTLLKVQGEWGELRTPLGDLRGKLGSPALRAGMAADCMVRPECLHLAQGAENAFRAVVVSNLYLGEVEQFVLEAGACRLRAVVTNPGRRAVKPGAEADVHFAVEDALLLPAEQGGGEP